MPRPLSLSLAALAFVAVLAGCGSSSSKSKVGGGTTTTAAAGPATTGTTQPPVVQSLNTGKNRYTVTVLVGTPSTTAAFPCSQPHGPGRFTVPFSLTIKNETTAAAPEAALGLILNDPQKAQGELAGIKLPQGPCVDFTLENNTIGPGQSTTYEGSASNVSRDAELDVSLKVAAAGSPANDFIKVKLVK